MTDEASPASSWQHATTSLLKFPTALDSKRSLRRINEIFFNSFKEEGSSPSSKSYILLNLFPQFGPHLHPPLQAQWPAKHFQALLCWETIKCWTLYVCCQAADGRFEDCRCGACSSIKHFSVMLDLPCSFLQTRESKMTCWFKKKSPQRLKSYVKLTFGML